MPLSVNDGLGIGQNWQDVTASRAVNTTYTNSTGKPMQVSVDVTGGVSLSNFQINGINAVRLNAGTRYQIFAIIPVNGTYLLPTGVTMNYWAELR